MSEYILPRQRGPVPDICEYCTAPLADDRDDRRFCGRVCWANAGRPQVVVCSECDEDWAPRASQYRAGETRCGMCRLAEHNAQQIAGRGKGKKRRHREVRERTRQELLEREARCQDCGRKGAELDEPLHVHHIEAQSTGGSDEPDNLMLLCRDCHLGQGWERHHAKLVELDAFRAA